MYVLLKQLKQLKIHMGVNLFGFTPVDCCLENASVYTDLQLRKTNLSLLLRYPKEKLKV